MHNCTVLYYYILDNTQRNSERERERVRNTFVYSIKKNMVRDAIKDYLNRLKIYVQYVQRIYYTCICIYIHLYLDFAVFLHYFLPVRQQAGIVASVFFFTHFVSVEFRNLEISCITFRFAAATNIKKHYEYWINGKKSSIQLLNVILH